MIQENLTQSTDTSQCVSTDDTKQLLTQIFDELPPEQQTIEKPDLSLAIKLTSRFDELAKQLDTYTIWLEGEKEKVKRFRQFIKTTLNNFMLVQYKTTKTQTLRLPNGYKLTLRKGHEKIEITDDDKVISWAKQHAPSLLSVKVSPNKTAIKNRLKKTGELPPGCEIKTDKDFSFNFSKT